MLRSTKIQVFTFIIVTIPNDLANKNVAILMRPDGRGNVLTDMVAVGGHLLEKRFKYAKQSQYYRGALRTSGGSSFDYRLQIKKSIFLNLEKNQERKP